jgi:hypothetical protein
MLKTEPHRALITGTLVDMAGRSDICSICGDTPALVYDDLETPYLPLRLCDDCIRIQQVQGARLRLRSDS